MDDFFRTPMGKRFFEATMPGLVEQLKRQNDNHERQMKLARIDMYREALCEARRVFDLQRDPTQLPWIEPTQEELDARLPEWYRHHRG